MPISVPHPDLTAHDLLGLATQAELDAVSGISNGDKGDITVSGTPAGSVWTIDNGAVSAAKVAADVATQAELDGHITDTVDAHDASAISLLDTANKYAATDVEGALAEIDAIAVTYPLDIDNSTDPAVVNIRAYTVPHLEANLPGSSLNTSAAEANIVTAGWTSTGSPRQINTGDIVKFRVWGTWLNNTGAGAQTDIRLRVGGLAGTALISWRIPTTVAAAAASRFWRIDADGIVQSDGTVVCSGTLSLSATTVGAADVYANTRGQTSTAITWTSNQEWVVTGDHDISSASLDVTLIGCLIEHQQKRP